ncbi:ATP-binding protein [Streptomyces sp. OE57]|uniref:ATP-binding protein n=1 Tax=Streptomyces lacaronensis TaxID=3379885 RepID=UPI0039B726EA
MLLQVLAERGEKNSIAIASNEAFTDWAGAFGDATVAAAMLDRLLHRAAVLASTAPPTGSAATRTRPRPSEPGRTPVSPDNAPDTTEVTSEMARCCPVCTTVFTVATATSRQVFCSPTCKETNRQNKPVQQTCPTCHTAFTTTVGQRRIYCSDECRTTSRTSEDAREKRTCPVCEGPFDALRTVRQIYCSPACRKTPNADATKPGTKTGPAASARDRHRRHCRSCHHSPNRSAERHHANQPWNATRWSRPRPGTVRTAGSRSPSSRCLRPRTPPAPLSPRPSPTSFRCEGLHDHPLTVTAHRARRPDGRRAHTVRPSNATGPIRC